MTRDEVLALMGQDDSDCNGELSCTEAAEALADLLIQIHGQVNDADFDALILIGSVLYRQGRVELESMQHAKVAVRRMRQGKA
jgi:hypothetical protein